MKCPICNSEMREYVHGATTSRERGYTCYNCEIGVFSYKGKAILDEIEIIKRPEVKDEKSVSVN